MRLMMNTQFAILPQDMLLISTNFAALMALRAFQTKNFSIDGHAWTTNLYVFITEGKWMWRKNKREWLWDRGKRGYAIFHCGYASFLCRDNLKRKKKAIMQCTIFLDTILDKYRPVFEINLGLTLWHVKCWTDNAPGQYQCHQNFIKIASIAKCHLDIDFFISLELRTTSKGSMMRWARIQPNR